jgi:hypothetical protein
MLTRISPPPTLTPPVPSIHSVKGAIDTSYPIEEMSPLDPVWSTIGIHLRFNSHINHIADELLTALLGSRSRPFIAIHLGERSPVPLTPVDSLPADMLESYASAEKSVQAEVVARSRAKVSWYAADWAGKPSTKPLPVLFATDSDDPAFIRKLTALGWIYINHVEFGE